MEETNTPTISTKSVGIRFGIIYGIISVAYFLIITIMGQNASQGVWSWLSYLIIAVFVFLAHKYYKDNGNGFMTYGQGMGITFWQALISVAISSPITYIYIKFIDTGFIDMIKDKQIEAMEQRGMSEEQIDQAMKIAGAFTSPEAILGFGLIGGLIVILIVGLIVSIFTQKKNPEAFV
jgi:hypothetical protein